MGANILVVDDSKMNRMIAGTIIEKSGYKTFFAENGQEALECLRREKIDVVLMDIQMPIMDGFEATKAIKDDESLKHIPIIIVTAVSDRDSLKNALGMGVTDYVTKPFDAEELTLRIKNVVQLKSLNDFLADQNRILETKVKERTKELEELLGVVKKTEIEVIKLLGAVSEYRDMETGNHILRVGYISEFLARQVGLDEQKCEMLLYASMMHDIGKVGISDTILLKPAKLSDEEFDIIKTHTTMGSDMLSSSDMPLLKTSAEIAITHHEKWDGSGYPAGLKGEEIPIFGRIVAIADVFDALKSERPYKKAFDDEKVKEIFKKDSGVHFDPVLVNIFLSKYDEILELAKDFWDGEVR
jgi:putative two-component system response regulator